MTVFEYICINPQCGSELRLYEDNRVLCPMCGSMLHRLPFPMAEADRYDDYRSLKEERDEFRTRSYELEEKLDEVRREIGDMPERMSQWANELMGVIDK